MGIANKEDRKLASEVFGNPDCRYKIGKKRYNGLWQELVFVGYRDGKRKWMVEGSKEAEQALKDFAPFPYKGDKPIEARVKIGSIWPYDFFHVKGQIEKDEYHNQGIELVKKLIKAGKKIRPILVSSNGHKLDGFKRYMAYKQLGYKEIDVIIHPDPPALKQKGLKWIVDEKNEESEV